VGLFRTYDQQSWPIRAYTPHAPFTYSQTWEMLLVNRGRTNNYGHIAPFDYVPGSRPVIVIGDSFVAAEMLPYADMVQAQLAERLHGRVPVYGFGFNGNALSDYLATAALAAPEFLPRAAVVVVVDGDISESLGDRTGHYFFASEGDRLVLRYHRQPDRSAFSRIREAAGDIALYKYVFANLHFTFEDILPQNVFPQAASPGEASDDTAQTTKEYAVVDTFLAEFSARSGISRQCTVLLLDSDRYALYSAKFARKHPKDNAERRQYLIDQARALGYRVVDLESVFANDYSANHRKLDLWPVDPHWNRRGHALAAENAFRELTSSGNGIPACLGTQ